MIVMVPKGLRGLIRLLAVELSVERIAAKLEKIEYQLVFALEHKLIESDQAPELAEMLLYGAKLNDAVAELRARIPA